MREMNKAKVVQTKTKVKEKETPVLLRRAILSCGDVSLGAELAECWQLGQVRPHRGFVCGNVGCNVSGYMLVARGRTKLLPWFCAAV